MIGELYQPWAIEQRKRLCYPVENDRRGKNMSEKTQIYDTLSEEQKTVQIPYYLHEGEMTRLERLNKRWFISFLIVLAMLFITNAGWIIYESQYQAVTVSQAVDTG